MGTELQALAKHKFIQTVKSVLSEMRIFKWDRSEREKNMKNSEAYFNL